jgi:hypothetical protein
LVNSVTADAKTNWAEGTYSYHIHRVASN